MLPHPKAFRPGHGSTQVGGHDTTPALQSYTAHVSVAGNGSMHDVIVNEHCVKFPSHTAGAAYLYLSGTSKF